MRGGIAREDVHYRIGPLTTYADAAELERKFRKAGSGERIVYAIGPGVTSGVPAAALARRWQAQGLCHLARRRDPGGAGWQYFIEKRPNAAVSAIAPSQGCSIAGRPEEQLLAVLARVAGPLPSLDLLAERARLPHRQAADYRLRLLVQGGFIKIRREGVNRFVEILKTGDSL
ncbi:hypothetical protein [Novosphingobium guangzhouense]|uniref:Uncharacterized protein n=1 Tax=Novosphingobium guangzhouense TaxID=1850347 RepID=A0A2K2FUR6_9SPHN|nr:hypothetical protein [Novosphingobium guangzhouense]PNU02504.1 hypothetical protein A8V01_08975 [Novosphingobium guangzhouense]